MTSVDAAPSFFFFKSWHVPQRSLEGILLFPTLLPNEFQVFVIVDVAAAHGLEVGCLELTIDEGVAELLHEAGKHDEGNLRGARDEREHAFAEEAAAQGDTIETANERFALPDLDTGGIVQFVQTDVGFLHVGAEPGAHASLAECSTLVDNLLEGGIDGDAQLAATDLVELLSHGVGDVNLVGEDDKALHGAPPLDVGFACGGIDELLAGVLGTEGIPWKDAPAIRQQQTLGAQIAAHGKQSIGFAVLRIGKAYCRIE